MSILDILSLILLFIVLIIYLYYNFRVKSENKTFADIILSILGLAGAVTVLVSGAIFIAATIFEIFEIPFFINTLSELGFYLGISGLILIFAGVYLIAKIIGIDISKKLIKKNTVEVKDKQVK